MEQMLLPAECLQMESGVGDTGAALEKSEANAWAKELDVESTTVTRVDDLKPQPMRCAIVIRDSGRPASRFV
jgi:hypothetical protein